MAVMDFYYAQERLGFYVHLHHYSVRVVFFFVFFLVPVDICTMNHSLQLSGEMCPYTIHAIAIHLGSAHKRSESLPISPDWDLVIVFSDKSRGLTVHARGLTDNCHC